MKDLYRGFKKVSDDDKSAKLRHENGHELTIAKSGLNRSTLKMLEKLPLHQANGTEEIQDPTLPFQQEMQPQLQTQSIGQQIAQDVKNEIAQGAANATSAATGEPVQKIAGTMAGEVPAQPPSNIMSGGGSREIMPPTVPSPLDIAAQGFLPGQGGLNYEQLKQKAQEKIDLQAKQREQEKSLAKQSLTPAAEAPSFEEYMATQGKEVPLPERKVTQETEPTIPTIAPSAQAAAVEKPVEMTDEAILESPRTTLPEKQLAVTRIYQKNLKELTARAEEERQKIKEIDPNRLWNNLSTWGKIRNTIGLILGGVGGGMLHTENPAARALDRMIEQDVEAQRQDNSNRVNLYKFHLDRLKDSQAAYEATMKNLKDVVINQMEVDAGLQPGKQIYKDMLNNKRLQYLVENAALNEKLAGFKTQQMISGAQARGDSFRKQDPSLIASKIIKEPAQLKEAQKEISRRKQLKQNAPLIMSKLDEVIADYGGLGGIVKTPDSVKDLEIMIRGLVPDVAGDTTGASKEATVQKLVNLLKPEGKFDVMFSDPQSFKNRVINWLSQNLTKEPVIGGLYLDDFDQTRIDPNMWVRAGETNSAIIEVDGDTAAIPKELLGKAEQLAKQQGKKFKILKQ